MATKLIDAETILNQAKPITGQQAHEIQPFGHLVRLPIALAEQRARRASRTSTSSLRTRWRCAICTRSITGRWRARRSISCICCSTSTTSEQNELVDKIAERIQLLGGVSIAMAHDVAETTLIPRPPKGREEVPVQISRLLHAHEIVLKEARTMARRAAEGGDDGTNDLLVSDVIRSNELQVWFVAEHVVDMPLVQAV